MPRHTHLMRRGSRYYLNVKVPKDLRSVLGKELIRKSLETSDPVEARKKVRYESTKLDAFFDVERGKLRARQGIVAELRREISDREVHHLVHRFFIQLENQSEKWWQEQGCNLAGHAVEEVLDTLETDEMVYRGGSKDFREDEGNPVGELSHFLDQEKLDLPEESPGYKKLLSLFRMARLENVRRSIDRLHRNTVREREPIFHGIFAHTNIAQKRPMTLGELLRLYREVMTSGNITEGTRKTYELPARILSEILGNDTLLETIQTKEIQRLLSLLRRVPANATKKYRRMTLEQAIKAADKKENEPRLKPKTLENYFNNISAIFKFAVERQIMAANPLRDRWLRAGFIGDATETVKSTFTIDELNQIFRSPLYTGCIDDVMGYRKRGPNRPRRGRFWLPLISLFHGLRCNEAAQLYTEDVCEEGGISYFEIRETRADGSKCDKHLKSKQSRRRVPIHPELVKIGFLDFVNLRREDSENSRLFPDLPRGASGYFSAPFSKWFSRFIDHAINKDCKATFHSFRHQFRTALGEAGVPIADVEFLGGWESMGRSSERRYDKPTLRRLYSRIEQVHFPQLHLSHLYPESTPK